MNYTFSRVAAFCGLRLSYYSTAALLTLIFLVLALTEYRTPTPLYILFTMAFLPSITEAMFFSNHKEKRENPEFPLFCKKYKYDQIKFSSMKIAYVLLFVLLAAWHISYTNYSIDSVLIPKLPAILAAIALLIRILGTLGYRLYFQLFPFKAMH